mmetsp:Transcript_11067/g.23832  ORF Transcript_11067/g.23832 Transcript_11067/m.23832 type:complete len:212 (+) Transcript_11067:677-1312(+)
MYVGLILRGVSRPVATPHSSPELGKQKPLHRYFATRENILNYLAAWSSGCRSHGRLDDTRQLLSHVQNLVHGCWQHSHTTSIAILRQKLCNELVHLLSDWVLWVAEQLEEVVVRRIVQLTGLCSTWVGLFPLELRADSLGASAHPMVVQLSQSGLNKLNQRQRYRSTRTADAHGFVPVWRDIHCASDGRSFATVRRGLEVPRGPQAKAAKD